MNDLIMVCIIIVTFGIIDTDWYCFYAWYY
jgi:hypothetical protein